jgi:fibronectin type 3 domain-containing protein
MVKFAAQAQRSIKNNKAATFIMEGLETRRLFSTGDFASTSKGETFDQTSNATPVLDGSAPFSGSVNVQEDVSNVAITSAQLDFPGDSQQVSLTSQNNSNTEFGSSESFSNQSAMDSGIPAGTYSLVVNDGNGQHTFNLTLGADDFLSSPPQITGYSALQSVDPTQPLTINWNSITGGTSSDFVSLHISGQSGSGFSTPGIFLPGALNGTSTSTIVPAFTLQPGMTYDASLFFVHPTQTDTTDYPSVKGLVGFSVRTQFTIATQHLAAPGNFAATSGAFAHYVALSWNAVTEGNSYQVFRNTVNDFSTATKVGFGLLTTSFNDTTAVPGTLYNYWVRARNGAGTGDNAGPVTGFANIPKPTNVAATSGTFTDHVAVTWNSVAGATSYQVFRNTTPDFTSATKIGFGFFSTEFDDNTAVPGTLYSYWVRGRDGVSIGFTGGPVTGFAQLAAPGNITASMNTFSDHVAISWDAVAGATSYQVFRSTDDVFGDAVKVGFGLLTTSFDDSTAVAGQVYNYWVRGRDGLTIGVAGGPQTGEES